MLAPLQTSPHQLSPGLRPTPPPSKNSVKKLCQQKSVQTSLRHPSSGQVRHPSSGKKVSQKNAKKFCPKTQTGGPPAPKMEPKMEPNPPKLRSGAGLGRSSGKKHENIKSVHYLLCFKHIHALPETLLFVTFWVQNWSRSLSAGGLQKSLQNVYHFYSKYPKKGLRRDPKAVPESSKFRPLLAPCSAPETSKVGFYCS